MCTYNGSAYHICVNPIDLSMKNNDNDVTQLFNNYADIVGGGISGTLGFLAGGPLAAAFAGTAGAAIAGLLRNIGEEFKKRQLSPREDF